MKKLFLVLVFLVSSFAFDWAGKVNWAMNYQSAKMISAQTHKPILVDIALSHCPPCKWIATNIYTEDKIAEYINKHFVPVLIIIDEDGGLPAEVKPYFSGYTPSLIIMDAKGKEITQFSFDRAFLQNKYKFIDYLKKGLKK